MANDVIRFYRRLLDLLEEKEVSVLGCHLLIGRLGTSTAYRNFLVFRLSEFTEEFMPETLAERIFEQNLPLLCDSEQKYCELFETGRALIKELRKVSGAEEETSEKISQEKNEGQDSEPYSEPRASEETV